MTLGTIPSTWAEYVWPEWVPMDVRRRIEEFWLESWGRGPKAWLEDSAMNRDLWKAPELFARATCWRSLGASGVVTGRFVHLWNSMGLIVKDDGTTAYASSIVTTEALRQHVTEAENRVAAAAQRWNELHTELAEAKALAASMCSAVSKEPTIDFWSTEPEEEELQFTTELEAINEVYPEHRLADGVTLYGWTRRTIDKADLEAAAEDAADAAQERLNDEYGRDTVQSTHHGNIMNSVLEELLDSNLDAYWCEKVVEKKLSFDEIRALREADR